MMDPEVLLEELCMWAHHEGPTLRAERFYDALAPYRSLKATAWEIDHDSLPEQSGQFANLLQAHRFAKGRAEEFLELTSHIYVEMRSQARSVISDQQWVDRLGAAFVDAYSARFASLSDQGFHAASRGAIAKAKDVSKSFTELASSALLIEQPVPFALTYRGGAQERKKLSSRLDRFLTTYQSGSWDVRGIKQLAKATVLDDAARDRAHDSRDFVFLAYATGVEEEMKRISRRIPNLFREDVSRADEEPGLPLRAYQLPILYESLHATPSRPRKAQDSYVLEDAPFFEFFPALRSLRAPKDHRLKRINGVLEGDLVRGDVVDRFEALPGHLDEIKPYVDRDPVYVRHVVGLVERWRQEGYLAQLAESSAPSGRIIDSGISSLRSLSA